MHWVYLITELHALVPTKTHINDTGCMQYGPGILHVAEERCCVRWTGGKDKQYLSHHDKGHSYEVDKPFLMIFYQVRRE